MTTDSEKFNAYIELELPGQVYSFNLGDVDRQAVEELDQEPTDDGRVVFEKYSDYQQTAWNSSSVVAGELPTRHDFKEFVNQALERIPGEELEDTDLVKEVENKMDSTADRKDVGHGKDYDTEEIYDSIKMVFQPSE